MLILLSNHLLLNSLWCKTRMHGIRGIYVKAVATGRIGRGIFVVHSEDSIPEFAPSALARETLIPLEKTMRLWYEVQSLEKEGSAC